MRITEGVESTWHYHLSHDNDFTRSFCGHPTMQTGLKLEQWGRTPLNYHIPERWCAECARRAGITSGERFPNGTTAPDSAPASESTGCSGCGANGAKHLPGCSNEAKS